MGGIPSRLSQLALADNFSSIFRRLSLAVGATVGILTDTERPIIMFFKNRSARVGLVSLTLLCGCATSTWQSLVSAVEAGLANAGATLAQLEAIVVQYFPQFAGDAAAIDSILQAVITLLQTTNVLPPASQASANALQGQIGAKIAAAKKTGWLLSPDASDVVAGIGRGQSRELVAAISGRVVR